VQAAIFEGLRLDGPSADVVDNPGRHHMETQPPIVRLSRTISPIRLPFIKAARKSPNAIADATATRPITRLSGPHGAIRADAADMLERVD
jgi:hypothetical protein